MNSRSEIILVDVTLTTVAAAIADNEVISQSIEIPNVTGLKGSSAMIQSIVLNSDDTETPAMDLVFSQVNTAIADAASEAVGNSVGDLDAAGASVLGHVSLSNYTDMVDFVTATKANIGLVVTPAITTTSIFVHAINRSGGNFTPTGTDDLHLRIGFIRS
tara:strand:- start:627 stop:1106 length:480 start_codon:yes stop_codon:yes gene_type:complete